MFTSREKCNLKENRVDETGDPFVGLSLPRLYPHPPSLVI